MTARALAICCFCCFALGAASGARPPDKMQFDVPRESVTYPASDPQKTIRIANWNIERGLHLDQVSAYLEREPADLYLFQEADWNTRRTGNANVAAELASRLHMNYSFGIEFEELGQEKDAPAYIGQATLTRLPIRRSRVLRFEHQSGFWQPHAWLPSSLPLMQRRLGSRIALVTDLEDAGLLLVVYNVHLESRSMGRIQARQLNEILADMKQYPAGTPIVLAGDINSKYYPSYFLRKLESEGFRSALGERIQRTHAIAMALDWIFALGPVKLEEGRVLKHISGSDHFPVRARLTLR